MKENHLETFIGTTRDCECGITYFCLSTVANRTLIKQLCSTIGLNNLFADKTIKICGDRKYPLLKISPRIDELDATGTHLFTYTMSPSHPESACLSEEEDIIGLWHTAMSMIAIPPENLYLSELGINLNIIYNIPADNIYKEIMDSLSKKEDVARLGFFKDNTIMATVSGKFEYTITYDRKTSTVRFNSSLSYKDIQRILASVSSLGIETLEQIKQISRMVEILFRQELKSFDFYRFLVRDRY